MARSRVWLAAAVVAAIASLGFGPVDRRSGARSAQLTYGQVHGRPLRLDLSVPDGAGPYPLVVLVHGGAWRRGRRQYMNGIVRDLAARGYAAATVDYRLADGARNVFPGPVSDVRCAIRTLRTHAVGARIDPDRVAVVGFSAGAHLASLVATAPEVRALDDGTCTAVGSAAVQSAVAFYGAYDLRAPLRVGPGADGAIRNFLGVSRRRDPARAELASPVTHVDRRDPPMLLVHGLRDRVVDVDQTRRMARALSHARVPVRVIELPHHSHGFGIFPRRGGDATLAVETLSFLRRTLGEPGPAQVAPRAHLARAGARPSRPARRAPRRAR